jgi:hypothetical protein
MGAELASFKLLASCRQTRSRMQCSGQEALRVPVAAVLIGFCLGFDRGF